MALQLGRGIHAWFVDRSIDGWTVRWRAGYSRTGVCVADIRVRPAEPGPRAGRGSDVPGNGITRRVLAAAIGRVKARPMFAPRQNVRVLLRRFMAQERAERRARTRPGRPPTYTASHYREVAEAVLKIAGTTTPKRSLAKRFKLSETVMRDHIRRAKQMGFLG